MEFHFTCVFCISNRNRKCWKLVFQYFVEKASLKNYGSLLMKLSVIQSISRPNQYFDLADCLFKNNVSLDFFPLVTVGLQWIMTTCKYKISSRAIVLILFFILDAIFCGAFFTVFKKVFRKQFNLSKIWFINSLVDCSPCLLMVFTDIFNIHINCHKIIRYPLGAPIISSTINLCFRVNTFLCINIFRIAT